MNKKLALSFGAVALLGIFGCNVSGFFKKASVEVSHSKQEDNMSEVVKSPSGLQWIVLEKPSENADSPKQGSVAQVHYTGWLADDNNNPIESKKFDSSVDRGKPFGFRVGVGMVIKGWDEGVAGMKVGEKRRFIIPPHLGYGAQGAGNVIPANATLVFDVTLLNVS
jgi:peptidylprolyl isomerase